MEMEHPYVVRWWNAFEGTGLCNDVINIIAGYCFYGLSFPNAEYFDEMRATGLFEIGGRILINKTITLRDSCGIKNKMDNFTYKYMRRLNEKSIVVVEKIFEGGLEERWNFCVRLMDLEDNDFGYNVSKQRMKWYKPIVVAYVAAKIQLVKETKRKNIAYILREGFDYYKERCFTKDHYKIKRWENPNGRKKKETICDTWTCNGVDDKVWCYPKYNNLDNTLSKDDLIQRIEDERKDGIIIDDTSLNKSVKFLTWYYMTEGKKMYQYKALKKAVKIGDIKDVVKYSMFAHLL